MCSVIVFTLKLSLCTNKSVSVGNRFRIMILMAGGVYIIVFYFWPSVCCVLSTTYKMCILCSMFASHHAVCECNCKPKKYRLENRWAHQVLWTKLLCRLIIHTFIITYGNHMCRLSTYSYFESLFFILELMVNIWII